MANDGFYRFSIPEAAVKTTTQKHGLKASGKSLVKQGGNGEIRVAMDFDPDGKLTKVSAARKLRPGPRPICQATKLLDPDPIVRRMAEQDILIMGSDAAEYLAQQRAKAGHELKRAIDRIWRRILEEER